MRERLLGAVIAVVLVAGGVAAGTDGGEGDGPASDDPLAALAPPLRDNVRWVVAYINGGGGADEIPQRFTERFLSQVPPDQLETLTRTQVRPAGPFRVDKVEEHTPTSAVVLVRGRTSALRIQIAVESHQIRGLLLQPAQEAAAPLTSWDDLDHRLDAHASHVAFLAAEIVGDECRPIHGLDADRPLPMGSVFKLYVLGALSLAVDAGEVSWDEPVTITEEHRVHSSADHGTTPSGVKVPVRDLAGSMISVSDNTATDHLMARIGRGAVEAALAPMGMANPELNRPFLTSAELTRLKFLGDPRLAEKYTHADEARRRAILRDLPTAAVTDEALLADPPASPTAVDTLEWFGSAADLCRAHVWLADRGDVVRSVLTQNPGADIDQARWPTVAFKGGSEPGVLALAWRLERADGRTFAVSALLMDPQHDIAIAAASDVIAAFDLLATT